MGAEFTIDDAGLERLRQRLEGGTEGLRSTICANLAEETINLVREGFADTTDPYGSGWAGTKRGNRPLHGPSGVLRNAWSPHSSAGGFGASSGVGYAGFHQQGTSRFVARKMVPDDDIPAAWSARYDEVVEELLDEFFGD